MITSASTLTHVAFTSGDHAYFANGDEITRQEYLQFLAEMRDSDGFKTEKKVSTGSTTYTVTSL